MPAFRLLALLLDLLDLHGDHKVLRLSGGLTLDAHVQPSKDAPVAVRMDVSRNKMLVGKPLEEEKANHREDSWVEIAKGMWARSEELKELE